MRSEIQNLYHGRPFAYALVDEQGVEREPRSVAKGLRSGRVVALVGWKSLSDDEIGTALKDAAPIALVRARMVAEFTK